MNRKNVCGGHALLRIVVGITTLVLMLDEGASAVNYISGCHDTNPINSPGEYVLTQDIQTIYTNVDNCIVINSDNVIFDGAGHWIFGDRYNRGPPYYGLGIDLNGRNNVTVKNVNVKNWDIGIRYYNVQNGSIINSTAWVNVFAGFIVWEGSNILINNSAYRFWGSIWYGDKGFTLRGNNTVDTTNKVHGRPVYYLFEKNNIILDGIEAGFLELSNSSDITIRNSFITYGDGIALLDSRGNKIYHNNISSNPRFHLNEATGEITWFPQAFDDSGNNFWDNGYPSGGNYWSDYKGTDLMNGPNQDQPGSDGIGDTPYYIDGNSGAKDRYPFMKMNGWTSDMNYPVVTNPSASHEIPEDTDNEPLWGETAQLNVTVTDDIGIAGVTVDLSEIGGSTSEPMINIGDNIWSATKNAPAGTPPGIYNLKVNATNLEGISNTSVTIALKVMKNGDTTGNGVVNIGDALRLANNVSFPGNPVYALSSSYAADVTGNGVLNIGDALRLANNVSFPGNALYVLK